MKLNAPPNTPVFTLQAKDPDSDPNLHYFLVRDRSKQRRHFELVVDFKIWQVLERPLSGGFSFLLAAGGRFEVDERSGVVRTRGSESFQLDMEYVLYVKAEDQNGKNGR